MNTFNLECLINKPTYLQSEIPSCIDLTLTNKKELFKHSEVNQVGISDHNSFVVTSSKIQLVKGNAKTKIYRDYSTFNMEAFKKDLGKSLNNKNSYTHFKNIFVYTLNKHVPIKTKILRFNNNSFMTNVLRKAINNAQI